MLADLFFALRRGWDQMTFWRQTYSPFSPWKRATDEIVSQTREEALRYGISKPSVDRRRAYQVARMLIADRHGDHLVDLLPDAHLVFNPPSAATFHSGKRSYSSRLERLQRFRQHPQTLAFLLTPPELARRGVGASSDAGLVVIRSGEKRIEVGQIAKRLRDAVGTKVAETSLHPYAELLAALHRGLPDDTERAA